MLVHNELDLLHTSRTHHAMIEFTRDCNMRCVYCAVSQPTWEVSTLDFQKINFDKLAADLKGRGLEIAILHGHGETTMIDDWHKYARKLLNAGLGLTTCTNMAREYTKEELDVLSEFTGITVSLDTIDPSLFRKLRRGGDIRQIIYNQTRVQALARLKEKYIRWIWSSLVVDQTIDGLLDLVHLGVSLGVEVFCFCNLTEHPGVELRHLSKLSMEESQRALDTLYEVRDFCHMNGAFFDAKSGLLETLEEKVGRTET